MYFYGKRNLKEENALVLLLLVLADKVPSGDSLRNELANLANEVKREAQEEAEPRYMPEDVKLFERTLLNSTQHWEIDSFRRICLDYLNVVPADENQTKIVKEIIRHAMFQRMLDVLAHDLLKESCERDDEGPIVTLVRLWIKWGGRISNQVKVVIVVAGDLYGRVLEYINKLAEYLGIEPEQIQPLKIASGSTHLLVSLPENSARFLVQNPMAQVNGKPIISSAQFFNTLDNVERKAWYMAPEPYQKVESDKPIAWQTLVHKARISPSSRESRVIPRHHEGDLVLPDNRPTSFWCILGLHDLLWDGTTCQQTGRCTRCGIQKKRIKHQWGDWFPDAKNNCRPTRVCERCGCKSLRTLYGDPHSWSQWSYLAKDECNTQSVCLRCGSVINGIHHKYERREYVSKTGVDCKIEYICIRCGDKTTTPDGHSPNEVHQWGPREKTSDGKSFVRCKRCGKCE